MPATVSPASNAMPNAMANANPIAQIASNSAGKSGATALSAEASEGADLAQFAALFQQMLGKQLSGDAGKGASMLPGAEAKPAEEDAAGATDALTALLPFMDAMGLTITEDTTIAPASTQGQAAAISAASLENQRGLQRDVTKAALMTGLGQQADAGKGAAEGKADGKMFAAQLVKAIDTAREQPHQPGTTAQAVQQVMATASPANAPATTATLQVTQPVGAAGWGNEVGEKMVWMANRLESRAELVLTPPNMGRVEISLTVSGDQATASFASTNPAVREALEAALPRLREILAEAGIQLGQAQVSAENARQQAQQEKHADHPATDRANAASAVSANADQEASSGHGLKIGHGLVDVFA